MREFLLTKCHVQASRMELTGLKILTFADDGYLFAASRGELSAMVRILKEVLSEANQHLNMDKTSWMSDEDGIRRGKGFLLEGKFIPRVKSMVVLGSMMSENRSPEVAVRHRLSAAWNNFWAIAPQLQDRDVCLDQRLRFFHQVIWPTLVFQQ